MKNLNTSVLYIAEKPSLAEAIAKALAKLTSAKASRSPDCWVVGGDSVAWLFGHMFELADPSAYDEKNKSWNVNNLPIVVNQDWKRIPHEEKKKHVSTLKTLVRKHKNIVHCGDAGREGQLLVDELLEEFGVDPFSPDVKRLWVRSMAESDLIDALRSLQPNLKKKGLSTAAWTRQRADWLHGINYTRLYTLVSGGRTVLSVGRVQTPTLKLVVDRDRERESFVPKDHFKGRVRFKHRNGVFDATWVPPEGADFLDAEGRILQRSVVDRVIAETTKIGRGTVIDWKEERKNEKPPLPYSLSALQSACASAFGMTAKEVLETAQSLYETYKVATYPRTDSRHLPLSLFRDEAPKILKNLLGLRELRQFHGIVHASRQSPAWNDEKVSDHHAIIPTCEATPEKIASLPPREANVFSLIMRSFVQQFMPDHVFMARKAMIEVGVNKFSATGREVVEPGWTLLRGRQTNSQTATGLKSESEGEEAGAEENVLPVMAKGDGVGVLGGQVDALKTEPPPAYTDGTLIKSMARVHLHVKDPEIRRRLKENDGIGTEATRAEIIETLLKRGFLTRQGKTTLLSTELGRALVDAIPPDLSDPGMTALWEGHLKRIENGDLSDKDFLDALQASIKKRVLQSKDKKIELPTVPAVANVQKNQKNKTKMDSGNRKMSFKSFGGSEGSEKSKRHSKKPYTKRSDMTARRGR